MVQWFLWQDLWRPRVLILAITGSIRDVIVVRWGRNEELQVVTKSAFVMDSCEQMKQLVVGDDLMSLAACCGRRLWFPPTVPKRAH